MSESSGHWPEPWPDVDTSLAALAIALEQGDWPAVTVGTVDDLARRLDVALQVRSVLGDVISALEATLIDSMEEPTVATPSGILRRVQGRASDQWRDEHSAGRLRDDLRAAIASRVALDVATGEMDPMRRNVALAAAGEALDALGKSGLNCLTAAAGQRFGVWKNEYRASVPGSYRVTLSTIAEEPS